MVTRPTTKPEWATATVTDPVSGQNNVIEPPTEKKLNGWDRLEYPNRQWFNWLGRTTDLWVDWFDQQESQNVVTNGDGVGLFPVDEALIFLVGVDNATSAPPNIIIAAGYKSASVAPDLKVIFSSGGTLGNDDGTLQLGTGTSGGDQPLTGGAGTAADIRIWGLI